jgi:hypothetical protein
MKTPKEIILETENARMSVSPPLKKGALCRKAKIKNQEYAFLQRAGLKGAPIRVDTMNRVRRVLGLQKIMEQVVLLKMEGEQ